MAERRRNQIWSSQKSWKRVGYLFGGILIASGVSAVMKPGRETSVSKRTATEEPAVPVSEKASKIAAPKGEGEKAPLETATFAAGCFWGMEEYFRKVPGVVKTRVGFTGGTTKNVKYEDTHDGKTGHAESVEIEFDPKKVSYTALLDRFFKMHDPTTLNRQGNDVGSQYRSAIFTHGEKQKKEALDFKARVERSGAWKKPITTEIAEAKEFWPASEEHQDYLQKRPGGYDNHFERKLDFNVNP